MPLDAAKECPKMRLPGFAAEIAFSRAGWRRAPSIAHAERGRSVVLADFTFPQPGQGEYNNCDPLDEVCYSCNRIAPSGLDACACTWYRAFDNGIIATGTQLCP